MPNVYFATDGDDGTGDGSQLNPYLTLEFSVTQSANDDTIIGADGIYDDAGNHHAIGTRSGLTIEGENDYGVTLTSGGVTRVVHVDDLAGGVTFGKIIIDSENNSASCVTTDSTADVSKITLDGTYLDNATNNSITSITLQSFEAKNGWRVSGNASRYGFQFTTPAGSTAFDIYDGSITLPNLSLSGGAGIFIVPSVTGVSLNVYSNTFDLAISSGVIHIPAVHSEGCTTVAAYNNTITNTGSDGSSLGGIHVPNDDTIACTKCDIYDNIINLGATSYIGPESTAIMVGDNSVPTTANNVDNASIYGNIITGCNHAILAGWVTGARAYNNSMNTVNIGYISKAGIDCRMEGGLIIEPKTQGLYDKGGTDCFYGNNTIIAKVAAPTAGFLYQGPETDTATNSTGCNMSNNICYSEVEVAKFVGALATTSTDTFNNNNFYSTVALPANPYIRNGTNYASLALWEAAVTGANNTEVDPLFTSPSADDYSLTLDSPMVATGIKWWSGVNPVGVGGEPFSDIDTDIGGIQSKHGDFHPTNL